jgi:DNA-binding PadR family transcriptional regulator
MPAEALKGHLDLLLLTVLTGRPAHGYAVIERLRERSSGTFDLSEGTIYPALHRLEEAKYVTSEWDRDGRRPRRIYRVTQTGTKALADMRDNYFTFSRGVRSVLGVTS